MLNKKWQYVPFINDGQSTKPVMSTFADGIAYEKDLIEKDYLTDKYDIHLLVPKDIVVIDIDNHAIDNMSPFTELIKSGILGDLKTHTVVTDTGIHLYFKNKIKGTTSSLASSINGPKVLKYFGFEVEIKNGKAKSGILVKVARQGEFRKVLNANIFTDIPSELTQFTKNQSLVGLSEGRNNEMLKIPNEYRSFVNDHVFGTPLSQHELDKISDYASITSHQIEKDYLDEKQNIIEYDFGRFLVNELKITDLNYSVVFKDLDGEWQNVEGKVGYQKFTQALTTIEPKTKRIYSKIQGYKDMVTVECDISNKRDVALHFENATLYKGRVYQTRLNDEPTPFTIKYKYNKNAYDSYLDDVLTRISSDPVDINKFKTEFVPNLSKKQLLIDIIAHCFITQFTRNNQTMFIFTGNGNNGKSTLQSIIKSIFGSDITSSIKLDKLAKPFQSDGLRGKLVNLGDDISEDFIPNTETLKSLISGDAISNEAKFARPIQNWHNQASMIFSANGIPKTRDRTKGWNRRVCIIPMPYDYQKDPKFVMDPKFEQKITSQSAIEYMIKLAVERYEYVYANGVEKPQSVIDATDHYIKSNNNVAAFVDYINNDAFSESGGDEFWMYDWSPDKLNALKINELSYDCSKAFAYYKKWCDDYEYKPFSKNKFIENVLIETNLITKKKDIRSTITTYDPNTNKEKIKKVRNVIEYFIRTSD